VEKRKLEDIVDAAAAADKGDDKRDVYRGTLLGAAAGNALGLPVEGEYHRSIERHYPGGITEVDAEELNRPWDDDLAQTAALAASIVDGFDQQGFADRLLTWSKDNGRGIGNLTADVMAELGAGTPASDAARVVWEQSAMYAAGNGAIMRCSPVALRYRRSGAQVVTVARAQAAVTHYSPLCQWSSALLCTALAVSLSGGWPDPQVLADAALAAGAPEEVGTEALFVQGLAIGDLGLDDPMDMGFTLKAMQVGLWAFEQDRNFADVLVEVVRQGGDTDTNAAIAGAVMGARLGRSAIPESWLANIPNTERLVELADVLLERSQTP
jgi:ADP-ribosylglycohydrolase